MASSSYRFFMLPGEAIELLQLCLSDLAVPVYHQLHLGRGIVQPVGDLADIPTIVAADTRPPIMFHATHQKLSAGPVPGTFKPGVAGIVVVWMPFHGESTLDLGSIGARLQPGHEDDAAVARALIRAFRKAAPPSRLVARSLTTGAIGPARGVGCSDTAFDLARKGCLKLRQWGVANVEYVAL
jgi:hypothetical protein